MLPTYQQLKLALDLACNMLVIHEPPDSRAVSNEFVALAAVQSGLVDANVMSVIEQALVKSDI
jgi:acyl-CoA reductase-like NAD-dependent aldehyde dehydrogenase